jgi:hypothetical protein
VRASFDLITQYTASAANNAPTAPESTAIIYLSSAVTSDMVISLIFFISFISLYNAFYYSSAIIPHLSGSPIAGDRHDPACGESVLLPNQHLPGTCAAHRADHTALFKKMHYTRSMVIADSHALLQH